MVASNIYLALGEIDGVLVMKVGMTDSIAKRQQSLKVRIDKWVSVKNRKIAFYCEERFRTFVTILEAKSYSGLDWFLYDAAIYAHLEHFLLELSLTDKPEWKASSLVALANIQRMRREMEASRLEGESDSQLEMRYFGERVVSLQGVGTREK